MHASQLSLILIILLTLASLARGWGGTGHQIICLIAEDHLTPKAKALIAELLSPEVNISDAEIASYADEVRRQRRETSSWHYINIPADAAGGYDPKRHTDPDGTIVDAIKAQAAIVADKSAEKEKRAEALKFLVHLVGDAHQPLHCIERDGDKGGNKRLVFYLARKTATNLHTVWDSTILSDVMNRVKALDYARMLDKRISAKQRKDWATLDVVQWVNESHNAALETAYTDVPADGDPPKLKQAYIDKAAPVIDQQLSRSGVRLAEVLNQAAGK